MRHAGLTSALPIGLLALAVILPACRGGLVSVARCPQLLLPYSLPAAVAAIALASITTRTDGEKPAARGVKTPPHAKALSGSICCHSAAPRRRHPLARWRRSRTEEHQAPVLRGRRLTLLLWAHRQRLCLQARRAQQRLQANHSQWPRGRKHNLAERRHHAPFLPANPTQSRPARRSVGLRECTAPSWWR